MKDIRISEQIRLNLITKTEFFNGIV